MKLQVKSVNLNEISTTNTKLVLNLHKYHQQWFTQVFKGLQQTAAEDDVICNSVFMLFDAFAITCEIYYFFQCTKYLNT